MRKYSLMVFTMFTPQWIYKIKNTARHYWRAVLYKSKSDKHFIAEANRFGTE